MPPSLVVRRKRSLSLSPDFDSACTRTRPTPVTKQATDVKAEAGTEPALLPDDMLLEVFKRLPPRDVVRCAAAVPLRSLH